MPKQKKGMFAELRRTNIVSLTNETGVVTIDELCEKFSVSPATVRNDLTELERLGLVQRTHGGAIRCQREQGRELTTAEKETQYVQEKRAIARAALDFIHPGDSIALDTGTTTFEIARLLTGIKDLTVITNDLRIADVLERESEVSVTLIGGMLRRHFHCTIGASMAVQLKNIYINTLFLATNGISIGRGFSTASIEVAEAKRALMKPAGKVVAVADSSKIGKEGFVSFANLAEVDTLISDDGIDDAFAAAAQEQNLKVIRA